MNQLKAERNKQLENIVRYENFTDTMFYRTNVRTHLDRVQLTIKEILTYKEFSNINTARVLELWEVHDDTEIIVWDIVQPDKENFTQEEEESYNEKCNHAIDTLNNKYWWLFQNDYKKLLLEEEKQDSLNYFIVKYVYKYDAHMEICHEIFAWNRKFTDKFTTPKFWNISSYEFSYKNLKIALNNLIKSLNNKNITKNRLFNLKQTLDYTQAVKNGTPHTENNIHKNTWYKLYDIWIKNILNNSSQEEIKKLYTQKEYK